MTRILPFAMAACLTSTCFGYPVAEAFTVRSGGNELACEISYDSQKDPRSVVLLLPGSGPWTRQSGGESEGFYSELVHTLNTGCIATCRFDKRGCGQSSGVFTTASIRDLSDDALAVLDELGVWASKRSAEIRLGIIGHSEGAVISQILMEVRGTRLRWVALLTPPLLDGHTFLVAQQESLALARGFSKETARQVANFNSRALELVERNQDDPALRKMLNELYAVAFAITPTDMQNPAIRIGIARKVENLMSPWTLSLMGFHPSSDRWPLNQLSLYVFLRRNDPYIPYDATTKAVTLKVIRDSPTAVVSVDNGNDHFLKDCRHSLAIELTKWIEPSLEITK